MTPLLSLCTADISSIVFLSETGFVVKLLFCVVVTLKNVTGLCFFGPPCRSSIFIVLIWSVIDADVVNSLSDGGNTAEYIEAPAKQEHIIITIDKKMLEIPTGMSNSHQRYVKYPQVCHILTGMSNSPTPTCVKFSQVFSPVSRLWFFVDDCLSSCIV